MWKRLWQFLKKPTARVLTVTYIVTVLCIAWALTMLVVAQGNPVLEIVSYVSYAFAAVTLGYSVYTLVGVFPKTTRSVKEKLRAHRLTGKLMKNYGFRTLVFSAGSMLLTVAYAVYNGVIALMRYLPVWYGALAGYYILLACMRGGILLYHGKRHTKRRERDETVEVKKYRNSGILLIVLIVSLSAAILQMVRADAGFTRPGLMIYVAATYTFIKITTAIVNFVRAKRQTDYTVEALRNVNAADAAVSVLSLQTAMLHEFGDGISTGVLNTATGAGVCLVVLVLGIYMIVKGQKKLNEWKKEEYDTEQ